MRNASRGPSSLLEVKVERKVEEENEEVVTEVETVKEKQDLPPHL